MAKIFVTGSADGLGRLAAAELVRQGHEVMLHARSEERARQALQQVPGAAGALASDLSGMRAVKELADKANESGRFDAVIHNAGVYQAPANSMTDEGLPLLLAVNTLAPYILTCLMHRPARLIYLSSGMHRQGNAQLDNLPAEGYSGKSRVTYADTKLHDLVLAKAVARIWPDVHANAVDPGWVPTKMGGAGAPDDLEQGYETQVWLAAGNDPGAMVSGVYVHHKQPDRYVQAADDIRVQEKLLALCEQITSVKLPRN